MAMQRAIATATRVAGDKDSNGKGGKGNGDGNKGVRQGTATATKRAMWTVTTSYVPTKEPTTVLKVLVLVEHIFVLKFLYSCAPFWNLARKLTCPCPFQKRCTGDYHL
jgi:hypothetical protein